jgi:hypothetical protein
MYSTRGTCLLLTILQRQKQTVVTELRLVTANTKAAAVPT